MVDFLSVYKARLWSLSDLAIHEDLRLSLRRQVSYRVLQALAKTNHIYNSRWVAIEL